MDGYVVIGTELNTKSFDAQIDYIEGQLQEIEYKLKQADMGFDVGDTQKLEAQYEKLVNQLDSLKKKQADFNKADLSNVHKSFEKVGDATSKSIKKIGRMTLAIFGVRSAYMAVRSAINTIAGDDNQLKADIDYMKDALAYSIEPIVRKIVDLAKQLMFYLAYLIREWTGKNIFENANKSLGNANKKAKDLKKTMSGFDEMNVTGGGTSGGSGAGTPSFDLSSIEEMEEPKWLIMIRDIGQWIIDNWQQVIFGLLLTKLFIDLLTSNWVGVIISFIGLLISAFFQLKDAIIAIYENGKIILGMFVEWIYNKVIKPVGGFFVGLWNGIVNGVKTAVNFVKNIFSSIVDFFKNIISKIVGLFKTIGTKVGDAIGGAFKTVINGILKAIETILNNPIKMINKLIDVINKVPGINLGTLPTFNLPRLAVGGVVNMPGRGVNYMGANIGERGAEGVIPLTNSQMMSELGKAIGQYVTINANITNTMNGRVISRELQKINNNSDFARNV